MIRDLVTKYAGKVTLITIYIKEAHPRDEWSISGDTVSACIRQPKTLEERIKVAQGFATQHHPPGIIVVDNMEDTLEKAYQGWPERLYVLDGDEVVFSGGTGPFNYKPEDVDRFLQQYLHLEEQKNEEEKEESSGSLAQISSTCDASL